MIIAGVALLAACTLIGVYLGDLLGIALGVKANVGGVGLGSTAASVDAVSAAIPPYICERVSGYWSNVPLRFVVIP